MEELFQEHFATILTTVGAIASTILGIIGAVVGWFARGRQRNLEADQTRAATVATEAGTEIQALKETFKQLQQMRADYLAHRAEMDTMRVQYRDEIAGLEEEVDKWREQHNQLAMRHHEFRVQSKQLYADYKELLRQFEEQRAELARFRSLVDEDPPSEFLAGRREGETPVLRREREEHDDWSGME